MKKKVLIIVAQADFNDIELAKPLEAFKRAGFDVQVAASRRGPAIGRHGAKINVDVAISGAKAEDYAALVFIGGAGAAAYLDDASAWRLARDFQKQGKVIGAICLAPSILANAGLLIGRTVTGFPDQEENLKSRGAFYSGMPVEVDGRIITARDPAAAAEFAEKMVYLLNG